MSSIESTADRMDALLDKGAVAKRDRCETRPISTRDSDFICRADRPLQIGAWERSQSRLDHADLRAPSTAEASAR